MMQTGYVFGGWQLARGALVGGALDCRRQSDVPDRKITAHASTWSGCCRAHSLMRALLMAWVRVSLIRARLVLIKWVTSPHPIRLMLTPKRTISASSSVGSERERFAGPVSTIACHADNSRVAEAVAEAGEGRVLLVDGQGALHRSLLGDRLAQLAADNGWSGVVVIGAVRDVEVIEGIDIGVQAWAFAPLRPTSKAWVTAMPLLLRRCSAAWRLAIRGS